MVVVVAASLCFVVFSLAEALIVSIPKLEYEHARGDNITLPCKFQPKVPVKGLVVITWAVDLGGPDDEPTTILIHYSTEGTDVPPLYEGRATLDLDIPTGKADLKLNSITLQDNKVFYCEVKIPGDDEGKLIAHTRLVVLVAPSTPVCALKGTAEYGQDVNLTCVSMEGSPTPVYTWEQRDVRNTPRRPSPRTTDRGGVLSLFNISMETSGYFTCTSKNKIRSASCNITLTVMPPSMNLGSSAGYIGGGIAVLLILALIIIACCCCRKKRKQREAEKYAMETPEEGVFVDKEPIGKGKRRDDEERSEYDDRRVVDGDRHVNDDDRRSDYTARRSDYDDRRSDFDDRRSDYDDRRSEYSDRRDRYDDRDDRRRDDDRDDRRRDDRRRDDDRRKADVRYDDVEPARSKPPSVPNNKPPRDAY